MIQNGQLLAVFNSAHQVMKAEAVLKRYGLPILLIPAPRALSTDCGLAIRYNGDIYDSVLENLTREGLQPNFIYRKDSNSHYETVWSAKDGNIPADNII